MPNAAGRWMKYEGSARGLLALPSLSSGVLRWIRAQIRGGGKHPTQNYEKLLHGD